MRWTFVFLLLAATAACNQADPLALARAAFARHDFVAAQAHLAEHLQRSPADQAARILMARTLMELGDGQGATAALRAIGADSLPPAEYALLQANAALLRQAPDQALRWLVTVPGAEAHRLRATAALQRGDPSAALDHANRAVAAGGGGAALADLARISLIRADLPGAQQALAKARTAAPDLLSVRLIGGELAARTGDLPTALADFERADQLYPGNVAVLTGKAIVLTQLGRKRDAEATLAALARHAPGDPVLADLAQQLAKLP